MFARWQQWGSWIGKEKNAALLSYNFNEKETNLQQSVKRVCEEGEESNNF